MSTTLRVSRQAARRFLRRSQLFDSPALTLPDALRCLGYVQIDPINVCGRMHDLILRNRVAGYAEGDLLRFVHSQAGSAVAFEHYLPTPGVLAVLPVDAWPHLAGPMRRRRTTPGGYGGMLSPGEARLADHILETIAARGPLTSDAITHTSRATTAWGTRARMPKTVLEKLFFHGRVLIAGRAGFRRVYDLPERVLPPAVLGSPEPPPDQAARWFALLRLRQRRLAPLRRDALPFVADAVQAVSVDDGRPLFCLKEDAPRLAACEDPATGPSSSCPVALLAPLDPLIYDRQVTRRLWDFEYTWEVYTPAARRERGYYALPVLAGIELVGHVHPLADRKAGRLRLVSRAVRRGYAVADGVRRLEAFLGLAGRRRLRI